jgi:L-threonate 2-dehydrogenase
MDRIVGVIGLGIMGGAMARNLVDAGFTVVGTDPDAAASERARAAGVDVVASAQLVAERVRDIITSLPSGAVAASVARAIAEVQSAPRTVIETSTLAIDDKLVFADILSAAGHIPLDCPLSGTGAQAKTRDLVIMGSGDAAAIARLEPVFMGFGRKVYSLGVFGNGSRMKFVANHLVAIHNVASAEAMVLGMKAGLDAHQIVEVISAGVGASKIFDLRAPMMANNHYKPATMKCDVWQKDMSVIGKFAESVGAPVPVFQSTKPIYDAGIADGHGDEDTAAVCAVLEKMAGGAR